MKKIEEIYKYFPSKIYDFLQTITMENRRVESELQEIRVRVNRPIILKLRKAEMVTEYNVSQNEILQTVERLCNNSIYAYKNQMCEGFITVKGGHRVGITGSIDTQNNTINNTLIISPPGKGKTTMLRDLIKNISNGVPSLGFVGKTCGIVDERGEIAAMYQGIAQNDVGIRTDVIENVSKAKGMKMLIRTMAPQVIACDEIGSKEDIDAIKEAMLSGVKGIFTMHGKNMNDIKLNVNINELIEDKTIEKIIFL